MVLDDAHAFWLRAPGRGEIRPVALPEPDRMQIVNTNSPHFRGYTRLGHEHTNGLSDLREQIDIGPERDEPVVADDAPRWMRLRGPNQWPPAVPEMR